MADVSCAENNDDDEIIILEETCKPNDNWEEERNVAVKQDPVLVNGDCLQADEAVQGSSDFDNAHKLTESAEVAGNVLAANDSEPEMRKSDGSVAASPAEPTDTLEPSSTLTPKLNCKSVGVQVNAYPKPVTKDVVRNLLLKATVTMPCFKEPCKAEKERLQAELDLKDALLKKLITDAGKLRVEFSKLMVELIGHVPSLGPQIYLQMHHLLENVDKVLGKDDTETRSALNELLALSSAELQRPSSSIVPLPPVLPPRNMSGPALVPNRIAEFPSDPNSFAVTRARLSALPAVYNHRPFSNTISVQNLPIITPESNVNNGPLAVTTPLNRSKRTGGAFRPSASASMLGSSSSSSSAIRSGLHRSQSTSGGATIITEPLPLRASGSNGTPRSFSAARCSAASGAPSQLAVAAHNGEIFTAQPAANRKRTFDDTRMANGSAEDEVIVLSSDDEDHSAPKQVSGSRSSARASACNVPGQAPPSVSQRHGTPSASLRHGPPNLSQRCANANSVQRHGTVSTDASRLPTQGASTSYQIHPDAVGLPPEMISGKMVTIRVPFFRVTGSQTLRGGVIVKPPISSLETMPGTVIRHLRTTIGQHGRKCVTVEVLYGNYERHQTLNIWYCLESLGRHSSDVWKTMYSGSCNWTLYNELIMEFDSSQQFIPGEQIHLAGFVELKGRCGAISEVCSVPIGSALPDG